MCGGFFLGRDMLVQAHRRGFGGFTLLEVLIVVSIVSLVMAVALPSLQSAREQARQTVCGTHLRQWGVAFASYADDYDGVFPHCDGLERGPRPLTDRRVTREDIADWHGWMDVVPPLIDHKPWRDFPRYGYPDASTFYQCPGAEPLDGAGVYSYRPERDGYFSYAMNSCLELDRNAWPPPGGEGYPMPSFLNTAWIRSPQRAIVLFDQLLDPRRGFDAKQVYRGAGKYGGSYPKAFAARHRHGEEGLGGNLLLADGHVEWRSSVWQAHWDAAQEVPPRDDPDWYPYPIGARRAVER
jgi:prepilin-type N-terminal cleavage/methylation domain-containing protein/prepilin-type processing-associated H-X9-DG protein